MDPELLGVMDLRSNAKKVIAELGDRPIAVLSRYNAEAVLLSAEHYEALLDRIEELTAELAAATAQGATIWIDAPRRNVLGARPEDVDAQPVAGVGRGQRRAPR